MGKVLTAKWERISRVTDLGSPSNILLLVFAVNSLFVAHDTVSHTGGQWPVV